ncbi:MAG: MIP/aquaporin family protein [Myxococcota bacterium]|nr:MIP/aquaporin family protein [Myxococcota bacterium]
MSEERSRVLVAEFLGTLFLLIGVVGSGIMAARLSPDDVGLQLLQNAVATGAVLVSIISVFGTISADFNPAVTIAAWALGHRRAREVLPIVCAQILGACGRTLIANLMFELPLVSWSTTTRAGGHLWFSEGIATVGLLLVVFSLLRTGRRSTIPWVVGTYITGAYYFTSSTSFANPAVTVARTLSDSFAGIDPVSAPMFILMQLVGTGIAIVLLRYLFPVPTRE